MSAESDFIVESAADVGRFFGYSRQTIYEWKTRGMPTISDGRFDLSAIAQWREASRQQDSDPTDIEQATLRDKNASAKLKELKYEVAIGRLVERDNIVAEERTKAAKARARIQAAPGELASSIPPEFRDNILITVHNFFDNLLRDLSECYSPKKPKNGSKRGKPPTSGGKSPKNGVRGQSPRASHGRKRES